MDECECERIKVLKNYNRKVNFKSEAFKKNSSDKDVSYIHLFILSVMSVKNRTASKEFHGGRLSVSYETSP